MLLKGWLCSARLGALVISRVMSEGERSDGEGADQAAAS